MTKKQHKSIEEVVEGLDDLKAFSRMADGVPVLMKDLDETMLKNVKEYLRQALTDIQRAERERIKNKIDTMYFYEETDFQQGYSRCLDEIKKFLTPVAKE